MRLFRPSPHRFLALVLLAATSACAGVPAAQPTAAPSAVPAAAPAKDERELANAVDKLTLAQLQMQLSDQRTRSSLLRKQNELEQARTELAQFEENDAPNQLARSKLELVRRHDSLSEQQEELAQLEMLYEKQDLADKTREIVLQRGKRRVERAQDELAISEREAGMLESQTLPRQRAKLTFEIQSKERELEEQKLEAQLTSLEKNMAVRAAEADLKALRTKAGAPGKQP